MLRYRVFRHKQASRMPVDQVEQGKQINPDDVDEMPVQAADLDWSVIFRREASLPGHSQKPGKDTQPDNHVEGVDAGHDEVKREKNLGVLWVSVLTRMTWNRNVFKTERRAGPVTLVKFIFVFFAFDAEEGAAKNHGQDEAGDQKIAARGLRGPNGEHYGQAAADEHGSVGGAERSVDGFAGGAEVAEVPETINQVGAEHAAEEHDFGSEENPHAQAGCIALLALGGEVMPELRAVWRVGVTSLVNLKIRVRDGCGAIGQQGPPGGGVGHPAARPVRRSCTLPRLRRALRRS